MVEDNVPLEVLGDGEGEVESLELSIGEVCELVDSELVGVGAVGVVGLNLGKVAEEDDFAVLLFSGSEVVLGVFSLELFKGAAGGRGVVVERKGGQHCQQSS